jgi:hypothetical protein
MLPHHFVQEIREAGTDLVVFSVMRNEMLRLHAWLRHYRQMGAANFAIIDNGSSDGTYEHLINEPDVTVTRLADSFAASNFGIEWLNELHGSLAPGTWILFADADEFLVYRGWPERRILDLAQEVHARDCNAVFGFLLDMYPDGPIEDASPGRDDDLFRTAPCFDSTYHFRTRPRKPWEAAPRTLEVIGGPRVRLLSSLERELRLTWFGLFMRGQIDRLLPFTPYGMIPWLVSTMPKQMPSLCKLVLARTGCGIRYTNNHGGEGQCLFTENVVVCHFKFLADFADRVRMEASRGEHYRCGAEYIMYADALKGGAALDLRFEGSGRFETVDQLIDLHLIRDISPYL